MNKVGGYLVDPPSDKDLIFDNVNAEFTKIAANLGNEHIIPEYTPISNQGNSSTCVSNSVADSLEILQGLNGQVDQMSRLFIYWNARVYTGETDKDEGSYIRYAFDSLLTLGTCSEEIWSFDTNNIFLQPSLLAYKQASDNKINSFYRIDAEGITRADQIETAIRANHPVVFGTEVGSNFQNASGDGVWSPPNTSIGRHAMILKGVRITHRGREFLVRNSWGESWSVNGHAWLNESYITWDQSQDFWVPSLMERLI